MAQQKKSKKTQLTIKFKVLTRTKSMIASMSNFFTPLYTVYSDFCKETTLHGLKHTVEPKLHYFERLLWFVVTVCAFGGAVYCGLNQLSRYNSDPVVVSLQRDYRSWQTTFPGVTVCFMERLNDTKAREVIETKWNVTEESDPALYQFYYDFLVLISDVSFRDNLQNFWKFQNDGSVAGIDLLDLTLTIHPRNELKVFKSQSEGTVHWYPVMTEVGMCHTFNSVFAQYQYMIKDKEFKSIDLLKCHYHSGQCYVKIESMDNAARFFIHSPYEISTAISNPTGEVQPGEEMIIDFKAVEIQASSSVKELRIDQRRCRFPDEWLGDSIKMVMYATRMVWPALAETSRFSSIFQRTSPSVPVFLNARKSTITHIPKRSFFASLGGTTALFVGASVLTVIETALFLIRSIVDYIFVKIHERFFAINYNP